MCGDEMRVVGPGAKGIDEGSRKWSHVRASCSVSKPVEVRGRQSQGLRSG